MIETENKKTLCDVCGDDMGDFIGLQIELKSETLGIHPEYTKVLDTFGKTNFGICFTCWLKALGIKPIGECDCFHSWQHWARIWASELDECDCNIQYYPTYWYPPYYDKPWIVTCTTYPTWEEKVRFSIG